MRGLRSTVCLELTSADTASALRAINAQGIPISRLVQVDDLTVRFRIRETDQKALEYLIGKRGDKLCIRERRGLSVAVRAALHRPVLILGLLFLTVLNFYLPGRVLFLRVEGNSAIPARQILEAAENCGIGFGASRRSVRSEKLKNALLEAIPELQWAGVNTTGCTGVISVGERRPSEQITVIDPDTSMVASRDGFILSADVTQGTPLVKPGQTVRAGQTLVSGYADCGICIRATGAAGEIFAETKRDFQAVTPVNWSARAGTTDVRRKYSLLFQKKRINLWKDSGICDATCGRMYMEYHVTLPGGFQLPVALCVETFTVSETLPVALDQPTAEAALRQFAGDTLRQQMVSGEILHRSETVSRSGEVFCLDGTYGCTEMIGRVRQMGETNGKRD